MIPTLSSQIDDLKVKSARAAKRSLNLATKARSLGNLADDIQNGAAHLSTVADKVRLTGWPDAERMAEQLTTMSQTIYKRL